MNYKEEVLKHYNVSIDTTYELTPSYTAQFTETETADGYSVYRRYDYTSGINFDLDVFYYPENMVDDIKQAIQEGDQYLLIDEEILEAIDADTEYGEFWRELYEKDIKSVTD